MSYSDDQVTEALATLPGWSRAGDAIVRTYTFDDFRAAIAFMTRAAGAIDEMDHHPEWTNVYDRVDVRLTSHDVGGITDRDIRLARVLDRLA
jgi:4a-hydroxytetrahydrobiopterin dehydratase